jgi:tRNA nucleotidyltransferase (CCA-adding enzyme)
MCSMKFIKIDENIKKLLDAMMNEHPLLADIVHAVAQHGGRVLLVGGAVRDLFLHTVAKDIDIEIHGLTLEQLELILRQFGVVSEVGKAYGVLRVHGLDVDWSVPRADSIGRKPVVAIDPTLDVMSAFERRDLTINAMGIDLMTHELIDPFNGLADVRNKILRAPNVQRFIEDPLRFFRVMQFISRFGMQPDPLLHDVCTDMSIRNVSIERIEDEFEKMMLKSVAPSRGLRWLRALGRLHEVLPELSATVGVQQNPQWHPEGDVFEHSMQALDAAAAIVAGEHDEYKKLVILYSALCHDLGKAVTTHNVDGVWRSLSHENAGVVLAKNMLQRITRKKDLIDDVELLVKYHMVPMQLVTSDASLAAYKRLAGKLGPRVTLQMLAQVVLADQRGRNAIGGIPLTEQSDDVDLFIAKADEAAVRHHAEKPVLLGRHLLGVVPPGKQMGELLKKAYEIQIEEGVVDVEELIKRVKGKK